MKLKQFERRVVDSLAGDMRCGTTNKLGRDRWVEKVLAELPRGTRILDAGAGQSQYQRFCNHLEYVSQDFAQYDGKGNGQGLQSGSWDQSRLHIISDITRIPEADASFDAIMCTEVLEHVPYPVKALRELVRLLKPGGVLIITAPFCSLTHQAPYFYQTGYSRYWYECWLNELGLNILDIEWNGNYFEYLAQEIRRLPAVAKKYTNSRLSLVVRLMSWAILGALGRFSKMDKGSEQLLCYGLHVRAQKKARDNQ